MKDFLDIEAVLEAAEIAARREAAQAGGDLKKEQAVPGSEMEGTAGYRYVL